ncbi:uncharacterized protein MELLADRAFT_124270 [Melampsora larici-populina 98AG31]|uniref:Secreted protein n=1 Tax=Melampsora larici-populina (strain 98AG31 / pathotype 3-4-7) TaxID=747676 RepID=F4RJU3_MELLP|nr:uncharacterized protein MELLADRAFT_124270 [Melampsora larici-populina 98AG31]EGG07373.1 secreted protein [Melampsora larici-populina 98AG31]
MFGTQLRNIILVCLISTISIVPTMCKIAEDGEELMGFSRIRPSTSELGADDGWRNSESGCAAIACSGITGTAKCYAHGCFLGCGSGVCM